MTDNFEVIEHLVSAYKDAHRYTVDENAKRAKRLKLIRGKVLTIAELTTDVSMSRYVGDRIRDLCMQILSQAL